MRVKVTICQFFACGISFAKKGMIFMFNQKKYRYAERKNRSNH